MANSLGRHPRRREPEQAQTLDESHLDTTTGQLRWYAVEIMRVHSVAAQ
jgi:hypothetical protein